MEGKSMKQAAGWRVFTILVFGSGAAIGLPAQTFTTLLNFGATNGANPEYMSLVQGVDGNLYGTTQDGGAFDPPINDGSIFKISPAGTLKTLHSFCAQGGCSDGQSPAAGLAVAINGNLYGTTTYGGTSSFCSVGCGTVFTITEGGTLTTLHSFQYTDGAYPYDALVQGMDGNFYGTTELGGTYGRGTVFKISGAGMLTTLHSFDLSDGSYPIGGLMQASDGSFYGTTWQGGTGSNCSGGCGTVFKITEGGTLMTLHSFDLTDGSYPYNTLIQSSDGNLYGTTFDGGANGYGTIFKMTLGGTLTTLHSFDDADGAYPAAGLVQATDGNLYGTTTEYGTSDYGTIFQFTSGGTLTTLHTFDITDGVYPFGGLTQATNGQLYGTTYQDGGACCGTVFSLDMGMSPFVKTVPTSGKVGARVDILGTNLTNATSMTFNGTPAESFTVTRRSEITTTVPAGATSGTVRVVTPSGTLVSNVPFRVRP
jgi:uncharacterized repeat protein (TIGR03803 family)